MKQLLSTIALTLAMGLPLLAQSPWTGDPSVNGETTGDASRLTNAGFVLSRSLYGIGVPISICSSVYNDGAFYTNISTTPPDVYQCTDNGGTYAWNKVGGGGGGAGVSSLNSLSGAVNLIAGSGISVTPSGSSITIGNYFFQRAGKKINII